MSNEFFDLVARVIEYVDQPAARAKKNLLAVT